MEMWYKNLPEVSFYTFCNQLHIVHDELEHWNSHKSFCAINQVCARGIQFTFFAINKKVANLII